MKQRTWRWVSRNLQGNLDRLVDVWQKAERPMLAGKTWAGDSRSETVPVCASEFKRLFGFVPKPGQCLKVEFSARAVPS